MDADDRQAVLAVLRVPGGQVGQRAQAVDAAVGPEVDQDDAAAQRAQRQRPVAGGVEPALGCRRIPERCRAPAGWLPVRRRLWLRRGRGRPADAVRGFAADAFERRLRRGRVLEAFGRVDQEAGQGGGDRVLELDVVVAPHRQRDDDHHRAHRDLQAAAAAGERRDQPPPAQHQEVEDDGGADPVAERHREAAAGERLRGGDDDHTRQNRPSAGRVDDAEAGADRCPRPKAVPAAGDSGPTGKATQPCLDPVGERRNHQRHPKDEQHHDRQLAQQVIGQAQGRDHVDERRPWRR